MRHFFATFLIIFISFAAAAQKREYATQTNIRYYPENTYKNASDVAERCVLDIYYPKDTRDFATIVWFHGGGLTEGSKYIPGELKDKGYCIIGVGYRLSPKVSGKTCIEDAAAAIAWVYKNIATYGGDPSRLFVSGHSAGGYLAMMAILDKSYLNNHNLDADKIAGLIPFSGQCITHFTIRKEKRIGEKTPTIDQFAPLFHVRGNAPPLLLITGDRELEMLGRYEENAYLARMMKISGHKNTHLLELDGYGHNMEVPAFPLLLKEVKRIMDLKK